MWLCAITGYHGLNVRIRSFTSCCATMLGNWANSPWWDLPSQWRAWHGPSPKVTFGVMMPNAGVPPDYTIMIPLLKLWNPSARSKELSSTVWICMDCTYAGKILGLYTCFLGTNPCMMHKLHAVSLQHHESWNQPSLWPALYPPKSV